jgi:hypothetical protein
MWEKMGVPRPYVDTDDTRTFENVNEADLVWHRDIEERVVTVLEGINWKLQIDNQLPLTMKLGETYIIGKMVYHRLLKGKGRLILKIKSNGKA